MTKKELALLSDKTINDLALAFKDIWGGNDIYRKLHNDVMYEWVERKHKRNKLGK